MLSYTRPSLVHAGSAVSSTRGTTTHGTFDGSSVIGSGKKAETGSSLQNTDQGSTTNNQGN